MLRYADSGEARSIGRRSSLYGPDYQAWVQATGAVVVDQPFFAKGNIATAGGCLASQYLAAWIIARLQGNDAAEGALHYVAPVGEKEEYIERAWRNITPYLPAPTPALV